MSALESSAAGVSVRVDGPAAEAAAAAAKALTDDGVPAKLAAGDPTLWGPDAQAEAEIRLGWLNLPRSSRELLPQLDALVARVRDAGLDHVVLAGMGGSSLAPEVITATAGVDLTVLDTTDAEQVRRALKDRPLRTVLVVSSKSGGTVETDSHRRIYEQAFREVGLSDDDIARRIVAVTDPGSPLDTIAREAGYEVVLADPNVGGRYSALTAFGLVPSALAGVNVAALLDDAAAVAPSLAAGTAANPALLLGAALGGYAVDAGHDKILIADAGSGISGFGDWAEQLIAESTGKQGRGLLPVVVESPMADGFRAAPDAHRVTLGGDGTATDTVVSGPLGAQFLVWEYATAVAGRLLGIDPFDQPNVQESKDNTTKLLASAGDGPLTTDEPVLTDGDVEVYGPPELLSGAGDLGGVIDALLAAIPDSGYLAVMAYLDRIGEPEAARLREILAARTVHPVTFGWGPRFLHSTGQYHKGGPQRGVFLQVTGAVPDDLQVPGRPYTLGRLQTAQALGDMGALSGRNRPTVRLHLRDRARGLAQVLTAAR
ncbi:MAG TPA: glucose-6-phosphate isomerase [Streptosporangiaceae bacterium]